MFFAASHCVTFRTSPYHDHAKNIFLVAVNAISNNSRYALRGLG
jgi:hypothetical protein